MTVKCKTCKVELDMEHSVYCSRKCYFAYLTKIHSAPLKKDKVFIKCLICKKQFVKKKRRSKFCSMKCYWSSDYMRKVCSNQQKLRLEKGTHLFWRGGTTTENYQIRRSWEMKSWRMSVFRRDNFTCIWCGAKSGMGKEVVLNADHIKPFSEYPELRFDINNGRTLCVPCHMKTDTFGWKLHNKAYKLKKLKSVEDGFDVQE